MRRYFLTGFIAFLSLTVPAFSCGSQVAGDFITLHSGRLICPDGTEARLYGVNFQTPLSWEYNRLAGVGVAKTKEALHKVADNNLDDLQMLGVNLLRCHLTPCDLTDAKGNLDESSVFLDAIDYLIAEADRRGMYVSFAFLNHMGQSGAGAAWIGGDRGTWIQDEDVVKCEKTYITALINHVNRYNNTALKDTRNIAYWELINEPDMFSYDAVKRQKCVSAYNAYLDKNGLADSSDSYALYRKETVREYINGMKDLLRRNGDNHLVCWGLNWHRYRRGNVDIFQGVSESDADIVAFCNYPGQDNAGQNYWNKNWNFTSNDFSSWFQEQLQDVNGYGWVLTPEFESKAIIVYEFETFFNQSAYLYPLQATYFRSLRVQAAGMWTYTFNEIAPYMGGSHFLNLSCTPSKMVSFLVAQQIFKTLPYRTAFPDNTNEQKGEHYVISRSHNGAIYSDAGKYINSCPVVDGWNPIEASPEVKFVAGCGSSPLVSYSGTGAYFIKDESGELSITLMPDVNVVGDVFSRATYREEKTILDRTTKNTLSIRLSAWEHTPSTLYRIFDSGERESAGHLDGTSEEILLAPGKYVIVPDNK